MWMISPLLFMIIFMFVAHIYIYVCFFLSYLISSTLHNHKEHASLFPFTKKHFLPSALGVCVCVGVERSIKHNKKHNMYIRLQKSSRWILNKYIKPFTNTHTQTFNLSQLQEKFGGKFHWEKQRSRFFSN